MSLLSPHLYSSIFFLEVLGQKNPEYSTIGSTGLAVHIALIPHISGGNPRTLRESGRYVMTESGTRLSTKLGFVRPQCELYL